MSHDEILSSAARLLRSGLPLETFVGSLNDETRRKMIQALAACAGASVSGQASVYAGLRYEVRSGSYAETRSVPLVLGGGGVL